MNVVDNDLVRRAKESDKNGSSLRNDVEREVDEEFHALGLDKTDLARDLAGAVPIIIESIKNDPTSTKIVCKDEYGKMLVKESYTSKCSFLDGETMEHHDHYVGKRVKRGLFRSATGIKINADVNGSYNIMRKAFPEAMQLAKADRGCALHPVRINIT